MARRKVHNDPNIYKPHRYTTQGPLKMLFWEIFVIFFLPAQLLCDYNKLNDMWYGIIYVVVAIVVLVFMFKVFCRNLLIRRIVIVVMALMTGIPLCVYLYKGSNGGNSILPDLFSILFFVFYVWIHWRMFCRLEKD